MVDGITRLNDEQINELIHDAESASMLESAVITNVIQMELLMRVIDEQYLHKSQIEATNSRLDRMISQMRNKSDDRFSSLDHEE